MLTFYDVKINSVILSHMNHSTIDNFSYVFWETPPNLNVYSQSITRKQGDTKLYQIYCQYIHLLGGKK